MSSSEKIMVCHSPGAVTKDSLGTVPRPPHYFSQMIHATNAPNLKGRCVGRNIRSLKCVKSDVTRTVTQTDLRILNDLFFDRYTSLNLNFDR